MFEGLDKIDWEALGCPDMLEWLHDLTSPHEEVVDEAFEQIKFCAIFEMRPAAPYLAPFLIELLTHEKTHDLEAILDLLGTLAHEANAYQVPDVLAGVEQGFNVYLALLEDPVLVGATIDLLIGLKNHTHVIAPEFLTLLQQKTHPQWETALIGALGRILEDNQRICDKSEYLDYIQTAMETASDWCVQRFAAEALVILLKEHAPAQVETILLRSVSGPRPHSDQKTGLWGERRIMPLLSKLGVDRAIPALLKAFSFLTDANRVYEALPILINMGFNDGNVLNYGESRSSRVTPERIEFHRWHVTDMYPGVTLPLNDAQKAIITAIVEKDLVWDYQTNIFALHGLPSTREELRVLVG
jgi:hypothetical protein